MTIPEALRHLTHDPRLLDPEQAHALYAEVLPVLAPNAIRSAIRCALGRTCGETAGDLERRLWGILDETNRRTL